MLNKDQIVTILHNIKDEPQILSSIEKIAEMDDAQRSAMVDILKTQMNQPDGDPILAQFFEDLRSPSFSTVVASMVKQLKTKKNKKGKQLNQTSTLYISVIVLLFSACVFIFSLYLNEKNNGSDLALKLDQKEKEHQEFKDKIGNDNWQEHQAQANEFSQFKDLIRGTWIDYESTKGQSPSYFYMNTGDLWKTTKENNEEMGKWEMTSDHDLYITFNEKKKKYKILYLDKELLIYKDKKLHIKKKE